MPDRPDRDSSRSARCRPLLPVLVALLTPYLPGEAPTAEPPDRGTVDRWEMGPFVKRARPILSPTRESRFRCPVRETEVRWEERNTYNPAAVVRDGKVFLLYRADDVSPDLAWGRTCRIGMAHSEDGVHFTRHPRPVVHPDRDRWMEHEWEGGCEDLHIVEGEDGTYAMNYTTWSGSRDTMSIATSRDLLHWKKHGPAFREAGTIGGRSGVVVTRIADGRLVAARIGGRYWMYYTHPCAIAWSEDLIDWTPTGERVWPGGHEAGAIALVRRESILLMFNATVWPEQGQWTLGQALVDRSDRRSVLRHAKEPFLHPEHDWEREGFTARTTVANALVPFRGRWLLYYGAADRHIGLAVFTPEPGSPFAVPPAKEATGRGASPDHGDPEATQKR